jgi:hypothetical protein
MFKKLLSVFAIIFLIILIFSIIVIAQSGNEDRYWEGQDVNLEDDIEENRNYVLTRNTDFVIELRSNDDGILNIDTENYGTGEFQIQSSGGYPIYNFTVERQNFEVIPDQRVGIKENMEFEILSNRTGFDVSLNSSDLTSKEIYDILESPYYGSDYELGRNKVYLKNVEPNQTFTFDTSELSEGEYDLTWSVTDTPNKSNTTIIKSEIDEDYVNFTDNVYSGSLGDDISIDINMKGVRESRLELSGEDYSHRFTVIDTDSDGIATVTFDTLDAGSLTYPVEGTDGTDVEQETDEFLDGNIDIGSYELEMYVGEDEISSSELRVEPPSFSGIRFGYISKDTDIDSLEDVKSSLRYTDRVSDEDYFFTSIEISGIHSDLNLEFSPEELENGKLSDKGISLSIKETFNQPNLGRSRVHPESIEKAYSDDEDDQLIFIISSSKLPNPDRNMPNKSNILNKYDLEFEIESSLNEVFDSDIEISKSFELYEYGLHPTNRELKHNKFDYIGIVEKDDPKIRFRTPIADNQDLTAELEVENGDVSSRDIKIKNGTGIFNIESEKIDFNDKLELYVPKSDQKFNYRVGSSKVLESIDLPNSVEPGETFNVSTEIRDYLEEYNVTTEVKSNILAENTDGTYTVPKAAPEDSYDIEVTSRTSNNLFKQEINRTIVVEENQAPLYSDLVVTDYSIDNYATVNETYTSSFTLDNVGNKSGSENVRLVVNEDTVDSMNLSVPASQAKKGELRWIPSSSGEYRVKLEVGKKSYSTSLLVEDPDETKNKNSPSIIEYIIQILFLL